MQGQRGLDFNKNGIMMLPLYNLALLQQRVKGGRAHIIRCDLENNLDRTRR